MSSKPQRSAQDITPSGRSPLQGGHWGVLVAGLLWGLWSVGSAFGGLPGADTVAAAPALPHAAGALIVIAIAVLPATLFWIAAVGALALLGFSALPAIVSGETVLPAAQTWGVSVAAALGLGAAARWIGRRFEAAQAGTVQVAFAVTGILLLGPALWAVAAFALPGGNPVSLAAALRMSSWQAFVSAAALVLAMSGRSWLLQPRDWAGIAGLGAVLGLIHFGPRLGLPVADLSLGLLLMVLLLPLQMAAVIVLMVAASAAFWPDAISVLSGLENAARSVPLAALLLAIWGLLARLSHQHLARAKARAELRSRQSGRFARLGSFQVDLAAGTVRADTEAAQLLGTQRKFPLSRLRELVRGGKAAEDFTTRTETGSGQLLRLSVQGQHGALEAGLWRREDGLIEGLLRSCDPDDLDEVQTAAPPAEEPVPSSTMEALHELQARQAEAGAEAADPAPRDEPVSEPALDAFSNLYARSLDLHDEPEAPMPDIVRESVRPIALLEKLKDELSGEAAEQDVVLEILVGDGAFEETLCPAQDIRRALILMFRDALEGEDVTTVSLGFDTQVRPEETRRIWTLEDDGLDEPQPLETRSKLAGIIGRLDADLRFRRFATGIQRQDLVFSTRAPVQGHPIRHPAHVLLVEDHAALRDAMAQTLRKTFAHVTAVADGKTAWAAYRATRPDLVLADLGVPGLSGDALLEKIREQDGTIPAFGLVASAGGREDKKLRAAGATDVLVKPLGDEALQRLHKSVAR